MAIIEEAKYFLDNSQPQEALELLTAHLTDNKDDLEYLQLFGEVLLENNQVEEAYNIFIQTCEMDPEGEKGIEKFLYLGQIIGGDDGIKYLDVGLNKLNSEYENGNNQKKIIQKLNEGIFAKIEIWMTDLCMEAEAESKCNELIDYALKIDNSNPEAYSLLASIRISQQRNDEAKEALTKAWELFQQKKQQLQTESNDINMEVVELIQPLMTVTKFAIEMELYDLAIESSQLIQDINDQILEVYYYETLANLFKAKQEHGSSDENVDYRDLPNNVVDEETVNDVKVILTNAFKVIQTHDDLEPELVESVNELLSEFGGPVMSELLPQKIDDNDDDWEDEIVDN